MFAILFVLLTPPADLPKLPGAPACVCKCGCATTGKCVCGASSPKLHDDKGVVVPSPPVVKAPSPKRWAADNGKIYETRPDGTNWLAADQTPIPRASVPPVAAPASSGCYIDPTTGRQICPLQINRWR